MQQQKPGYLQFLNEYTYVPGAEACIRQLLIKYKQESIAAALSLLPQQASSSFITIPARVIAQDLFPSQDSIAPLLIKYYHEKIYLSLDQISILEQTTRGQCCSEQWYEARRLRISGINFRLTSIVSSTP
ncbi:unnamed protein product [Rotaria sp. Silwood1]|nr:unnamed protein product [Rotaria sp. Silwood1]CAF4994546.1 unnamed protein product [Rotaria sp. Silwood1]